MFNTILFDVDGVLLSEERYFDASALTVYELLFSPQYMGLTPRQGIKYLSQPSEEEIVWIRKTVFADNAVLNDMKRRGVNSNWDMVYLQFATQLLQLVEMSPERTAIVRKLSSIEHWSKAHLQKLGRMISLQEEINYASFMECFQSCDSKQALFSFLEMWYAEVFPDAGKSEPILRSLWVICQQAFQEWYLGEAYLPTQLEDKVGFVNSEIPLVEPIVAAQLFQSCLNRGIRIGIATGRPAVETRVPFESFGWWEYFDVANITTAADVLAAETAYPADRPLAKPHPFAYLRSYYGSPEHGGPKTAKVIRLCSADDGPLVPDPERLLIVGDSVADLLAAKAIGCRFAGVLTGLSGETVRGEFERLGADYIWPDITSLQHLLGEP